MTKTKQLYTFNTRPKNRLDNGGYAPLFCVTMLVQHRNRTNFFTPPRLMEKPRYSFGLPLAGAALLSGCAVYVPTVPSTPLLRSKGETEITAAVRGLSSLEAGAAWSPAPHLLVTGEAALQVSNQRNHQ